MGLNIMLMLENECAPCPAISIENVPYASLARLIRVDFCN